MQAMRYVLLFLAAALPLLAAALPWRYCLGKGHAYGVFLREDHARALPWLRAAAEAGNVRAQIEVAWAYKCGRGVAADPAEAAAWFRRAADKGSWYARTQLGEMYYLGLGMPQDYMEAYRWFVRAGADAPVLETVAAKLTPEQLAQLRAERPA
jgi:TPR repeat protein